MSAQHRTANADEFLAAAERLVRRVGDRFDVGVEYRAGRPYVAIHDTRFKARLAFPVECAVDLARAIECAVDRIVEAECARRPA